jgi:hypothetical protein
MADASERTIATRALIGALLGHAAIFAAVLALPRPHAPVLEPPVMAAAEVEVEVVASAVPSTNAEANANADSNANVEANARPSSGAAPSRPAEAMPAPAGGEAGPEATAGPITLLRETPPPPIGIALQGTNPFQERGALPDMPRMPQQDPSVFRRAGPGAPTNAQAKDNAEAALRAPARERERELGLGPDGPVLTALSEAVAVGSAPVTGRAVFLAIADGTGLVIGIDVVSCDGGRDGWASAAQAAHTALKGKKLRMPSTAKRAEMRIEITSTWKMPSGHDPGVDVSLLGLPLKKGEGKQSSKIEILNPIPKLTAVQLAPDVNVSVPTVNLTILGVHGDPADIGAKPRRVVHSRLLDSKVL